MTEEEYYSALDLINDDVQAILHWQQVIADVHEELDRSLDSPTEQDFIYYDRFGSFPADPEVFDVGGVSVTVRTLHQTGGGLRDIKGADLLYEIEGEKYVLIQYKRARPKTGNVKNDPSQLGNLLSNCPDVCMYKRKARRPRSLPFRLNGYCGCWYRITDNSEHKFYHACEAEQTFGGQQSRNVKFFRGGVSKSSFDEMFASCRIGAITRIEEARKARQRYVDILLEGRHLIFEVIQTGRFS